MFTKIPKPTSRNYTNVNALGKEQYDQALTYDSALTFYDGVNPNQWTDLNKPVGPAWTKITKPT